MLKVECHAFFQFMVSVLYAQHLGMVIITMHCIGSVLVLQPAEVGRLQESLRAFLPVPVAINI